VTSGRVVLQMRQKLRAVTFPRLDSEALPEIVVAGVGDCSWRHELDAVILTSLPVTQPVVAERNGLLADHDRLIGEPLREGTNLQPAKLRLTLAVHDRGLVAGEPQRVIGIDFRDLAVDILGLVARPAHANHDVKLRHPHAECLGGFLALLVVFEQRQPRQPLGRSPVRYVPLCPCTLYHLLDIGIAFPTPAIWRAGLVDLVIGPTTPNHRGGRAEHGVVPLAFALTALQQSRDLSVGAAGGGSFFSSLPAGLGILARWVLADRAWIEVGAQVD